MVHYVYSLLNPKNMRHTFRFYQWPSNRWCIDLPGREGSISELEMVEGADMPHGIM